MVCILHGYYQPPQLKFSLSPPPPKAIFGSPHNMQAKSNDLQSSNSVKSDDESSSVGMSRSTSATRNDDNDAASDYNQWLHAMKLVAHLPGGMPPEFRRKLWLSLADKYLKSKNVDWTKEEEKCFCEKWREDDEELGIQIVKDLHRTGSNLCSINQAKLKRILLGYARYNPEVGYCQGFNMLGALILQVMDKQESESMKVMIYLVEGVLPQGYFCGSMGGLQADMGVFRELMQTKLPRLAKHLQKLQGPIEHAYEPPLTNVFTMQWFLTLFCTCLPMTCVLRVWDLVLIEGSDVLLRTALVLWSLLEERVLSARTADEFYCKMGSFSSELLNGHLIDSNGLIEKVVQLGPIADIQKLRDKHLYNITPLGHKQGLQLYFDGEEPQTDEESHLAVATVWGIPWGRRGSHGHTKHQENKERIALDISLLKKQYDRLRERQKQAHIILTTACTSARQSAPTSALSNPNQTVPVNQLLMGRSAIINKGKRSGPPRGAIPPARKPSLPIVLQTKPVQKQLRRGETLHWQDMDISKQRRESLTWKEIKADRAALLRGEKKDMLQTRKIRTRLGKSDSSSYSEDSDGENEDRGSSTDTSLCDDEQNSGERTSNENSPRFKLKLSNRKQKEVIDKIPSLKPIRDKSQERKRPKSWAPSNTDIPFMLMTADSPIHSDDEDKDLLREDVSDIEKDRFLFKRVKDLNWSDTKYSPIAGDLATTALEPLQVETNNLNVPAITSTSQLSPLPDIQTYLGNNTISPLPTPKLLFLDSTNSLGSGDGDECKKFDVSDDGVTNQYFERVNSVERPNKLDLFYSLNEEDSIRNAYVDTEEPPINEEHLDTDTKEATDNDNIVGEIDLKISDTAYMPKVIIGDTSLKEIESANNRRMELLIDYSEKSSAAFIAEATSELHTTFKNENINKCEEKLDNTIDIKFRSNDIPGENRNDFKETYRENIVEQQSILRPTVLTRKHSLNNAYKKRRDPRRLTLVKCSTIDNEEQFQDFQNRFNCDNTKLVNIEKCDKEERIKQIPTTADLEERFHTLERQLTIERMRNGTDKYSISIQSPNTSNKDLVANLEHDQSPSNNLDYQINADITDNKDDFYDKNIVITSENSNKTDHVSTLELDRNDLEKLVKDRPNNKTHIQQTNHKRLSCDLSSDESTFISESGLDQEKNTIKKQISDSHSDEKGAIHSLSNKTPDAIAESNQTLTQPSAQQLSSISTANKKDDIQLSRDGNNEELDTNKKKSNENQKISKENETTDVTSTNANTKKHAKQTNEEEIPIKKTPPSTAELENRFNALERQFSVQKTSQTPTKKEPPDDATVENRNDRDKTYKSSEKLETNEEYTKTTSPTKQSEAKIKTAEKAENSRQKRIISIGSDSISKEDTEASIKIVEKETLVIDHETPRKKSPPSTEELEKRFAALEKQLSTTSIDGNSKPKENHQSSSNEKRITKTKGTEKSESNLDSESNDQMGSLVQNEAVNKKSMRIFEQKCKTINESLTEKTSKSAAKSNELKSADKTEKPLPEKENSKSKRRASEPPSTEDLEKRYEILKRRMSFKNVMEKELTKSETVEEALQRIENEIIEEIAELSDKKDEYDIEQCNIEENQSQTEENIAIKKTTSSPKEASKESIELKSKVRNTIIAPELEQKDISKYSPEDSKKVAVFKIPVAPPLPSINNHNTYDSSTQQHRRAVIEELQNKIKTPPNGENLKPSVINPNKKTPPHKQRKLDMGIDGTTETHAITAFNRLENNEQWHMQTRKMVRRFSDLPSRADLENRLQFLEKQLSKKFYKQRCASDSEVASKRFGRSKDEKPNTSNQINSDDSLEYRVQALEKQLSENSLKLLEAMQSRQTAEICQEIESTKQLSTETIDATGKELVRYTHFGEVEDSDSNKPINISINIKMLVKDDKEQKIKTEKLPTTEQLEKRLEILEQQLKLSKNVDQFSTEDCAKQQERCENNLKTSQNGKSENETKHEKHRKDQNNEEVKNDLKDSSSNIEVAPLEEKNIDQSKDNADQLGEVKHLTKEKKTLENKEIVLQKSTKGIQQTSVDEKKTTDTIRKETLVKEVPLKDEGKVKVCNKQNTQAVEHGKISRTDKERDQDILVCDEKFRKKEEAETAKQSSKIIKETDIQNKQESNHASLSKLQPATGEDKVKQKEDERKLQASKDVKIEHKHGSQQPNKEPHSSSVDIKKTQENNSGELCLNEKKKVEEKLTPRVEDTEIKTGDEANAVATDSSSANMIINATDVGPVDPNNKTLVLLLDNEPKAVKVRRLTRANTEELENLFQALEKQLSDRNLIKSVDGKLVRAESLQQDTDIPTEESKAISDLTKEIEQFTNTDETQKIKTEVSSEKETIQKEEEYDWGADPVKKHLKRKTVYLPSTKELEARFRSLERQIKFLEDVEKIDVEQRLNEIERKIKLQYSLSHEKDLSKFLELCENKGLDETPTTTPTTTKKKHQQAECQTEKQRSRSCSPKQCRTKSACTSPIRIKEKTPHTSPIRTKTPHTSPARARSKSPYTSPAREIDEAKQHANMEDLEYRYRILELKPSKSKENLDKIKNKISTRKQPIHPIEMLLDSSPDDSHIPTTGELEHRMRVLDEKQKTFKFTSKLSTKSPTDRELPTEDELEARLQALEEQQSFDIKMQNKFKEFNQKLRDEVSPSLSFEEFKAAKSREASPHRIEIQRPTTPKSALRDTESEHKRDSHHYRSTSPKVIRFSEDEELRTKSRIGQPEEQMKTIADASSTSLSGSNPAISEGLDALGTRLMRQTSPLRRTGTHTGVPLRTDDNINDRLNSIKNTIKSIDSLCEEKPYRKERCQRYIDSLFSDSVHFSNQHKKSLEDLSRSESRKRGDYAPSIRVSDHSYRPSEYLLSRSMGSAESIRSTSPLRAISPPHYRSNRDLRRDVSPRRRRDEEREEYESRVRRENYLPNYYNESRDLNSDSLTKFYKVDRQLDTYKLDDRERSNSRYGSREILTSHKPTTLNTTTLNTKNISNRLEMDKPISPYRQTSHNLLGYDTHKRNNTPIYAPTKLDIRHTTVTSTFYDRLLAEKQIEKTLSRPPSRSPVISPSITNKSYLDLPIASANTNNITQTATTTTIYSKITNLSSPLTTMPIRSYIGTTGSTYSGSGYTENSSIYIKSYTNTTTTTTTTTISTLPNFTSNLANATTQAKYSATTPTGNSSTYLNAFNTRLPLGTDVATLNTSHITVRSCDNILMQLKSNSTTNTAITTAAATYLGTTTTTITTTTTTTITSSAINFTTYNFTSLYNTTTISNIGSLGIGLNNPTNISSATNPNPIISNIGAGTNTNSTLYSTGAYNSLMPLTVRQATDSNIGTFSGLYPSAMNNNYTSTTALNFGSTNELPKT
ncbi:uncharacterized protein LOC119684574 isoform X2 [Teleopsis dalmanni]|uniref:uncharacterized protein LOC119684574 isoform X2 n=1 Tax=Teleopsis dalmanni TaxID=139649 RepID=UPI0018CD7EF0|nr:uncharacterized protein LOC119684574 isoform X2 [Teleopsis dalmanni]